MRAKLKRGMPWALISLVIFWLSGAVQGQNLIFLSPILSNFWNGGCSASCPSSAPCGIDSQILQNSDVVQCELVVLSGIYVNALVFENNQPSTTISLQDGIEKLNFSIKIPGDGTLIFKSEATNSELQNSSISLSSPGQRPKYTFANLTFDFLSSVTVDSATDAETKFTNCRFNRTSSLLPFIQTRTFGEILGNYVAFISSSIFSPPASSPFMSLNIDVGVELFDTNFTGDCLARLSSFDELFLHITGSSEIRFYGPSLLSFAGGSIPNISILFDSLWLGPPRGFKRAVQSSSSDGIPSVAPATLNSFGQFWHLPLYGLHVKTGSISSMSLNASWSHFESCTITSCAISFNRNELSFLNVNYSISDPESYLRISITSNQSQVIMQNLTVSIDESQLGRKPFVFDTFGAPLELLYSSSLSTNALWLEGGSHLVLENLTVTGMISSTNSSFAQISVKPGNTPTMWSFNSIVTTNIILNLANLDTLKYWATSPELGIRIQPSSLLPVDPPSAILFDWSDLSTLMEDIWFPLMNQLARSPQHVSWMGAPTININITFNTTSSILEYQLLNLPPTPATPSGTGPPPSTCPPPPAGFMCVGTSWVIDGGGDGNVTTMVVPGNSGIVQVFGNLTIDGVLIFDGTGTQLNVSGCIKAPSVEVSFEGAVNPSANIPAGPVVLMKQNGFDCPNSLLDSLVSVNQPLNSCKKVSILLDPSRSSSDSLSVLFSLDESKCIASRSWRWILLGSLLGVAILTGILTVSIWHLWKVKHRGIPARKHNLVNTDA